VTFQLDSDETDNGAIELLICKANNDPLTVGSLVGAFGSEKDGAVAEIHVEKEQSGAQQGATGPSGSAFQTPTPRPKLSFLSSPSIDRSVASVDSGTPVSQTPKYLQEDARSDFARPNFGFQITGSPRAFGGSQISPAQQGVKAGAFLLQAEYEPSFLQSLGVFSIGPSVGIFPSFGQTPAGDSVTSHIWGISEFGGQARYQFRYWDGQLVVPYAAYEFESVGYSINQGGSGRLAVAGGSGGLAFFINRLAPGEANDFYRNMGVSRSYFVVEGKYLSGSDQNISVGGTSVYFGFRFER
jgi:hypothetical protein